MKHSLTAGNLRHRIAFDLREEVSDGYGNEEGEFVEQFVVWAGVEAKFGGETVTQARLSGKQPFILTIRQSTNARLITTDWRARDKRTNQIFNIRSIADPNDRRAFLELLVEFSGEFFVPESSGDGLGFIFSNSANSGLLALLEDI